MRILQLRFCNLNSLYGQWSIDFTHPQYLTDGLFAITGPTGSGKSTILDAICLALYGRTPRLDTISQSTNEIMSRQTGECFAEVTFETKKGSYRCYWSQKKAYGKADGRLGDSKHELSQADTGVILESRKREIASAVEDLTGMDFDRFTRSMLLAQGRFATFLNANADQRSPILEQITGTAIYSGISMRVFERNRDELGKLEQCKARTQGIVVPTAEQEDWLHRHLEEQSRQTELLTAQEQTLTTAMAWLRTITDLKVELSGLEEERQVLQVELEAFEPLGKQLGNAMQATELESDYAALAALRSAQQEERGRLSLLETDVPHMQSELALQEGAVTQTEQALRHSQAEQKKEAARIVQVRALDTQLMALEAPLVRERGQVEKYRQDVLATQAKQAQNIERQRKTARQHQLISQYIQEHACDGHLMVDLAGTEQRLLTLDAQQGVVEKLSISLTKVCKDMETISEQMGHQQEICESTQRDVAAAVQEAEVLKIAVETALEGHRLLDLKEKRESLLRERLLLARIARLEEDRGKLEDGTPCPLCGSLHHPFAEGNLPIPDGLDIRIGDLGNLIAKVEGLQEEAVKQSTAIAAAKTLFSVANADLALVTARKSSLETDLNRLEQEHGQSVSRYAQIGQEILTALAPYGYTSLEGLDTAALLSALKARVETYQENQAKDIELTQQTAVESASLEALITALQEKSLLAEEAQTALQVLEKDHDGLLASRIDLYGHKYPEVEEQRLQDLVEKAEKAWQLALDAQRMTLQKLDELGIRRKTLLESIAIREPELGKAIGNFNSLCQTLGFKDEQDFLSARLPKSERDQLQQQDNRLHQRQVESQNLIGALRGKLAMEQARQVTSASFEELSMQHDTLSQQLEEGMQSTGAWKQSLQEGEQAKALYRKFQVEVELQQKECERWGALNRLIGQADGKKYRNFAQGLTFDLMIAHANRQLAALSDRYLLIRDAERPLELNILDNYQAGEIRSTKNLSGGESFIVSLALALGLSSMASHKVRVESLFLDEGFGTLDEEALEMALGALSTLHSKGKLIGIISHVPALRERIGTQITVQPKSGGKSVLYGPGCCGGSLV